MLIHQQADLYRGRLSDRADEIYALKPGHAAYFHVISGNLKVNGVALGETDGLGIEPQQDSLNLTMNAAGDVDFLLFDMNIAEARP